MKNTGYALTYKSKIDVLCGVENLKLIVGKTYTMKGFIEKRGKVQERGFRFYRKLEDTHISNYISLFDKNAVVFKVKILGTYIQNEKYILTNKFKVLETIKKEDYSKNSKYITFETNPLIDSSITKFYGKKWVQNFYNSKGFYIGEKHSNGFWTKFTLDKKNRRIKKENSNKYWEEYKYDGKGRKIKEIDSEGSIQEWKYDSKGNLILFKEGTKKEEEMWEIIIED